MDHELQKIAADDVMQALTVAQSVANIPRQLSVGESVQLAAALLRLRDVIGLVQAEAIVAGSRLRMSTQLLQDLHAMPGHESVTVRVVRIETAQDGVAVLVLRHEERPS